MVTTDSNRVVYKSVRVEYVRQESHGEMTKSEPLNSEDT